MGVVLLVLVLVVVGVAIRRRFGGGGGKDAAGPGVVARNEAGRPRWERRPPRRWEK